MTAEFIEAMRKLLIAAQAELASTTESLDDASKIVELDQTRVGRLTRMDAMQAQAMAQATQNRRRAQRKLVDLALARIESGAYGTCESCDEYIAEQRLRVDPTATLCIQCASAAEP